MNDEEREMLYSAVASVEILKHEVVALNELVIALAIALTEKPAPTLSDVSATLNTMQVLTRWRKGEEPATCMDDVTSALTDLKSANPLQTLLIDALLHHQAGDAKRQALQTWLAQASGDEIAQDVRSSLKQLLSGL